MGAAGANLPRARRARLRIERYEGEEKGTTAAYPPVPPWRGIHHLALITPDRDETVRFYRDVLGMHLIGQGEGNQLHGRTAFLTLGEG